MKKARLLAKRLLFWSGLVLMIWPAWELSVRMDSMAGPLGMFWRMAVGEGIPLARVWSYIDWSIFATPTFLLQCTLLGLFAFGLRGRGYGCLWLAPVALLLGCGGASGGQYRPAAAEVHRPTPAPENISAQRRPWRALNRGFPSKQIIITTSKLVVWTSLEGANAVLPPCKGHRSLTSHQYLWQPL